MARSRRAAVIVTGWLVLLAALLWIVPPAGDDAYAHSIMAVEQAKCWRHGVIWPRFHPDWNGGTGSFLPAVYSPVALSVDAALALATNEGTRAVALSLIAALGAGAFFMWLASLGAGPPWWLFACTPYLLVNVFSRATVTETWALAAVAGGLVFLLPPGISRPREGLLALTAAMVAAGAQPVMLIIVGVPVVLTWLIVMAVGRGAGWKRNASWGAALMAGAAIFWLPPLLLIKNLDQKDVFSGQYGWHGHFVTNIHANGRLGPVLLAIWVALGVLAVVSAFLLRHRFDTRSRAMLIFAGACLVLASPMSVPLWRLPGLRMAQFPWRFLGPASIAVLYLLGRLPQRWRRAGLAAMVLPAALMPVELGPARPMLRPDMSARQLASACSIRYGLAPVLPSTPGEYAAGFHPLHSLASLGSQRGIQVTKRASSCVSRVYRVKVSNAGVVLLPVQWWPFWRVRIDGIPATFADRLGLVGVNLDAGTHGVALELGRSGARLAGGAVTGAGILMTVFLCVIYGRHQGD